MFRLFFVLICLAFGSELVFATPPAILVHFDAHGHVVVRPFQGGQVDLGSASSGLILWADGDRDRWQFFTQIWSRPSSRVDNGPKFDFETQSRGSAVSQAYSLEAQQSTTLLTQLSASPLTRGGGGTLTPYEGAILLNPCVTFRRQVAEDGEALPAVDAKLSQDGRDLLTIRFPEGVSTVRWGDIPSGAENLKLGLPPGNYQLELPTPTGPEYVSFSIAEPLLRDEVLASYDALSALQPENVSLATQIGVEQLIEHRPPLLTDAIDLLEALPAKQMTQRLKLLKQHVAQRLQDPGQASGVLQLEDEPTNDPDIDSVRAMIAASNWEMGLEKLHRLQAEGDPRDKRRKGLVQLYCGVILGESGAGKEQEAIEAFRDAIQLLHNSDNKQDRYRAHNNYANFLLGLATDRLHNHAFQMAAGVRLPLVTSMQNWIEAKQHFEAASQLAVSPGQIAAVQFSLARTYILLADMVQTMSDPDDPAQRFSAAEDAARTFAGSLLHTVLNSITQDGEATFVVAASHELLAQISFRRGEFDLAEKHARRASELFQDIGVLPGLESVNRLLGLCLRTQENDSASTEALNCFLISEQLSEILRDRYPQDKLGLSRAGFSARRAYVTEHIIDLFASRGQYSEALYHVEKSKARSFRDTLSARSIDIEDVRPLAAEELLSEWPNGVVALEFFVGSTKTWVFFIDSEGVVNAQILVDESGRPMSSRLLVNRIQKFIAYLDLLGPGSSTRVGEGRRIAYGGKFDWAWQDELHSLFHILIPEKAMPSIRRSKTCLIVPHHILHYFPFAALVTEPDRRPVDPLCMPLPRFLVDEPVSIANSPSIATWRALRSMENRPLTSVNGIGVVSFGGLLKPLPGVSREMSNLEQVFGPKIGTILSDEAVTPANVTKLLAKPGILSIGTHGMKEPDNPLEGYLVCRDESGGIAKLTAAAVYSSNVNSDLVILNACYGGFGDRSPSPSDDLFGMQRALLQGGARTVISGLWDIYDATSPDLMADVYRQLHSGSTVSASLSQAQRNHLNTWRVAPQQPLRFLTHPYYWAVFTVAGDDRTGGHE